jgi:hypothetical protein
MPIRINLLAEQQAEEEARRRDPVKRAVWVVAVGALLMALWAGLLFTKGSQAATALSDSQARLAKIEKEAGVTRTNMQDIARIEKKMDALVALATNRFLWAPQLDVMQRAISAKIQLTRVRASQSYTATAAEKSPDGKKPGKKASVSERVVVTIEGKDFGTIEEQNYGKFKEQMFKDAYFRTALTNESGLQFKSFSPIIIEPSGSYFRFILECSFPEKIRN